MSCGGPDGGCKEPCWTWTCADGVKCGHGHHASPAEAEDRATQHQIWHAHRSGKPMPPPDPTGRGNELVNHGLAPVVSMTHVPRSACKTCPPPPPPRRPLVVGPDFY